MTVYEYEVYHDGELFTFDSEADAMECARALTKDNYENNYAYVIRKREFGGNYNIYTLTWWYDDVFLFEVLM